MTLEEWLLLPRFSVVTWGLFNMLCVVIGIGIWQLLKRVRITWKD